LNQGQHGAARDRLALAGCLDAFRRTVKLAILLVVVTVHRRVEHVVLVVRRERDLVGARGAGDDGQGERGDESQYEGCSMAHRASCSWMIEPCEFYCLTSGERRS